MRVNVALEPPPRLPLTERGPPTQGDRLRRSVWRLVWALFFRPSPTPLHGWRRMLLRAFGASIGSGVHVYPSARIWAPWNLVMRTGSCLADGTDCYNVARVEIGQDAVVSQRAFICTASHDTESADFKLVVAEVLIEARAWVAAEAFIAPGVTLGEGAVALARAVVVADVPPWTIVAGHPARPIRARKQPPSLA